MQACVRQETACLWHNPENDIFLSKEKPKFRFHVSATKRPSPLFKTNKAPVEYFNGSVSQSWSNNKHTPLNEQISQKRSETSPDLTINHYADIRAKVWTKTNSNELPTTCVMGKSQKMSVWFHNHHNIIWNN